MRVLFITGNYLPGKNGGIENYTHWLASVLIENRIEVEVAALQLDSKEDYFYEGVKVHNLTGSFGNFEQLLEKGNYNICHFQEYSAFGGIELHWFEKAKEYAKVFFTFHRPYFTCYKNDFRYKDVEDCDTFNDPDRCSRCVIADKTGYSHHGSDALLDIILGISAISGVRKKFKRKIIAQYKRLDELTAMCDAIFVYAKWFKKILAENGYDSPSIKMIPYKTKPPAVNRSSPATSLKGKILFVGRIEYQKGLHLLCAAMARKNNAGIQLDVYGNIIDQAYFDACYKEYPFNFKQTISYPKLMQILGNYDFLVMPSVFTEMYSMMIKDASYAQLPVIASAAKGNKDAVEDGVNGFLFNYNDSKDLGLTIDKAYALKKKGWVPVFQYPDNPGKDIDEIVSLYN